MYQNKTVMAALQRKYPDRVPVVLERAPSSKLTTLSQAKYLIPKEMTIGHVLCLVRRSIKLRESDALFILVKDHTMPTTTSSLESLFNQHKDADGILRLTYVEENVFGGRSASKMERHLNQNEDNQDD